MTKCSFCPMRPTIFEPSKKIAAVTKNFLALSTISSNFLFFGNWQEIEKDFPNHICSDVVSIGVNNPQSRPAPVLSITVCQRHECLPVFISHPLQCDAKVFLPLVHINLDRIILRKALQARPDHLSKTM